MPEGDPRARLRVAIVNSVWDRRAADPEATLDRFVTLTGWAEAIARVSADTIVSVFQRFHADAELARGSIAYRFVGAPGPPRPSTFYLGARLTDAVAALAPDLVHVNGLDHPLFIRNIRRRLPSNRAIVVQDHGGFDPPGLSRARAAWMRHGLAAADALLVATPAQVEVFRESRLVRGDLPVHDVMEGSTTLRADVDRDRHTPLSVLWVGRLNANKDPLTVLEGFRRFVARGPRDATLTYVYGSSELERELRRAIDRNDVSSRVRLVGAIPNDALAAYYDAADLFVLGSRHEGSGYAALEAMACGVAPVVTDIPSFRSITNDGRIGALWRGGDPESLAGALTRAIETPIPPQRRACRAWFDERFSWDAIGRRAAAIYRELART